jgi:Flp pilus assembly protein TadB
MTGLLYSSIFAAAVLLGAQAFADDSVSRATPTKHQSMKECIEKQKTADVTMSKSQMARICRDELKRQNELGESTPPPTDTPHDH